SAVCPGCNILLVEAASNALTDLASAVDLAASYDPAAISNSYYAQIDPVQDALLAPHYDQPGIAMTVASGDGGYGATFPASLDTVIAVGATTLWAGKNGWQETVWAGTGFGCSPLSPKPKWQRDHQCPMRTHNDVSIVGDPLTGVLIYDTSTPGYKGWSVIGGTSVGAPLIAALYAASGDAGNANGAQALYAKGNNAFYQVPFKCPSSMIICSIAGPYSAAAGLGAPKGLAPF
ncbi:MAG: peptidase S8, partial [Candidatus Eremiobacteraeota bacterium]|nr:peptidase S8 [Candidatus Eremiobacteraeota bacterium]